MRANRTPGRAAGLLAVLAIAAAACRREEPPAPAPERGGNGARADGLPPTARPETVAELRADLAAARHAADGGGTVRLVLPDGENGDVTAGSRGRWTFEYTAGPLGIRAGGALYLQVSPFWGWSSPQTDFPRVAGYTTVETAAAGVELELQAPQPTLLVARIGARDLQRGQTIRLTYGAGPALARADQYAERRAPFLFAVDGDGDGVRERLAECPAIDVLPNEAALLAATLSSTACPGGSARLTLAVLDVTASAGVPFEGRVALRSEPEGLALPDYVALAPRDAGAKTIEIAVAEPGTWRVRASIDELELEALSNPLWAADDQEPVFWGDLHGHSGFSDGTGLPEDYFRYARDVAALDLAALTDHDHFGLGGFLDRRPDMWAEIRAQAAAFHQPGRFVTLLGYEWTNWIHGHRHVLYFEDTGEVLSSIDERYETPAALWDALRGRPALTFAHHSAGQPIATDWSFAPDPVLEPLTEVMSVHGSSEAADCPTRLRGFLDGNAVRDALDRGFRLGLVGSGDGHDGHPGHTHLSPFSGYQRARPGSGGTGRVGTGGLAAIRARELTRSALLEAMRARRTYATSGPRILLELTLDQRPQGSAVAATDLPQRTRLWLRVSGTAPIDTIDVIRSGALLERVVAAGALDLRTQSFLEGLGTGEYVYVRVVQRDRAMAWSSPVFVE